MVSTSRWAMVISDYNSIRARLLNTSALEGINLALFSINETTLTKWYKDDVRRDEIRQLMQGLPPQEKPLCADIDDHLPPARELPSSVPPPVKPHMFSEPEDTSGQATVRRKSKSSSRPPANSDPSTQSTPSGSASQPPPASSGLSCSDPNPEFSDPGPSGFSVPDPSSLVAPGPSSSVPQSRTTAWRHKRIRQEGKEGKTRTRKVYTCQTCGQPMTSEGHTQFKGQRYCPHAPDQVPQDEWLKMKKEEAARKRQQGPPAQ